MPAINKALPSRYLHSMKFLNVYCDIRQADVYVNLDKVVLLQKLTDEWSLIVVEGTPDQPIKVAMPVAELIRRLNGEDRAGVGFRRGSL